MNHDFHYQIQFPGPVKFPIKTTSIAQYAALAAKSSCRAAFVNILIAELNKSVNTTNTPTALKVSLLLLSTVAITAEEPLVEVLLVGSDSTCAAVLVRWYIVRTGMTSKMKMTKVIRMLTSLSMQVLLYKSMYLFDVFSCNSGVLRYFCRTYQLRFLSRVLL